MVVVEYVPRAHAIPPAPGPSSGYPDRPVRLIVPFPPGGVVDIMGRGLAGAVSGHLPVPVEPSNSPGADGTAGISEVLASDPDGYTIGLGAAAILSVQPHLMSLTYRSPRDCALVVGVASLPTVLSVRGEAPWKTAPDLLEWARANPGALKVGIAGIGRISHLNLEQLRLLAGIDLTVVPFEGPKQIQALLDGHVDAAVANQNPVLEHVRANRVRVMGVFQARRSPALPDVPTFAEHGYEVTLGVHHFLVAPHGTPRPAVLALHDAFRKALAEPSFVSLAGQSGFDIDYRDPEELSRDLDALFEQCGRLVRRLGLRKQ